MIKLSKEALSNMVATTAHDCFKSKIQFFSRSGKHRASTQWPRVANGYHTGSADADRPITPDGSIGQLWSAGYTEMCPSFVCPQSSSQRRCFCQSPLCPC